MLPGYKATRRPGYLATRLLGGRVPAQHAAAVDDPRVQVASQQKVELLQKQRNGQADSEEAERAAIEEEGAHAHAHAPHTARGLLAIDGSLRPNPQRVGGLLAGDR